MGRWLDAKNSLDHYLGTFVDVRSLLADAIDAPLVFSPADFLKSEEFSEPPPRRPLPTSVGPHWERPDERRFKVFKHASWYDYLIPGRIANLRSILAFQYQSELRRWEERQQEAAAKAAADAASLRVWEAEYAEWMTRRDEHIAEVRSSTGSTWAASIRRAASAPSRAWPGRGWLD